MLLLLLTAAWLATLSQADAVFRPAHVVVVIEENKPFRDIIGNENAPYINLLASQGALLERSYALTHPSLPNYLALFSGSTHGITDDGCRYDLRTPNLAQSLQKAGASFAIFSEDLPEEGSRACAYRHYRKKHNPVAYFPALPAGINRPLRDFPADYSKLPTIAFVVPNQENDMHDGSVKRADTWLHDHMDSYLQWAHRHNSLLILTWDEDDRGGDNHIVTVFAGAGVRPGHYPQRIDHYDVLATLAAFYGASAPGAAARRAPVTGIWKDRR